MNAIAPGPVSFPEDYSVPDKELVLSRTPLGREGHPDDIANSVLLLSRIPYMTGHILHVDGGRSALQ